MTTLVIGVGSPIRGDDGVGLVVADRLCRELPGENELVPFDGSGLDLLGLLARPEGVDRVVLVDSLDSGEVPQGQVVRVAIAPGSGVDEGYASSHHVGVLEAFRLAARLGVRVPEVRVYAVGIARAEGFSEGLSPGLAARVDAIVREIRDELEGS